MTGPAPRPAPPIDPRGYADLVADTERLAQLLSGWRPPAGGTDLGRALIALFAGMAEQVARRLDAVPDRDFLAFLELLGAEPLPARAATVPLTFTLPQGSTAVAFVPAGTPAAAPVPGAPPARFFTERDLVVGPSTLAAAVVLEPQADRRADVPVAAGGTPGTSWPAFTGDSLIEHALYVAHDGFTELARPRSLSLDVQLADAGTRDRFGALPLEWTAWDGAQWQPLATTGAPIGEIGWIVELGDVAAPQETTVGGRTARWLRARLPRAIDTVPGAEQLGVLGVVVMADVPAAPGTRPVAGLAAGAPVDLSGDVYPFGEQPRFGDVFAVSSPVLGRPGGQAVVDVRISPGLPVPPGPSGDLVLVWEVGGSDGWVVVGRSTPHDPPSGEGFADGTTALTQEGQVSFPVPATGGPVVLGGVSGWWLRVRIAAGNYGTAAGFQPGSAGQPPVLVPATFAPPALASILLGWRYQATEQARALLAVNGEDVTDGYAIAPFAAFTAPAEDRPALHLGFDLAFPNRPVLLYFLVDPVPPEGAPAPGTAPLRWEYASPVGWSDLGAVDETRGLTRSGPVGFVGPPDLAPTSHFGRSLCWLRVRPGSPGPAPSPLLRRIMTNTVPATAAISGPPEVLGNSDGSAGQAFVTARRPVLDGERVEVLADAGWTVWERTPDFAASGPLDRHYLLDRELGEVRFGDGRRGAVPAPGAAVRATYASGGGRAGNLPPGTVTQLEVALAGVDRVLNHEAAGGGADPEPIGRVRIRGPLVLRHGDRAVAAEDYADLAASAAPDVARALAVPVAVNPLDVAWIDPVPVDPPSDGPPAEGSVLCTAPADALPSHSPPSAGRVIVAVVPESADARPAPSRQLLDEVADELRARCPAVLADGGLTVVGPVWIGVTVRATVAVADPEVAQTLPAAVTAALDRFLHPLTGGPDGGGWAFGRAPHRSDLVALVSGVPGTDHVVHLDLAESPDRAGLSTEELARALVWSGGHAVTVVPAGAPA